MRFKNKNRSRSYLSPSQKFITLLLLISAFFYQKAHAEFISLPLISSGFSWEASTNGTTWIPAYPEYPNGVTIPYPQTTDAVFMWYWNIANGNPTGSNGSNTAYFRSTFMLTDLHGMSAGAWIAADDWMRLTVNGTSVATYQLDINFNNHGQTNPLFVDFTALLNTRDQGDLTGYNTITIEAHDGGPTASNRGYEWLFFDAYNVNSKPVLDSPSKMDEYVNGNGNHANVPEPGTLLLLLAGLPMLTIMRKGVAKRL